MQIAREIRVIAHMIARKRIRQKELKDYKIPFVSKAPVKQLPPKEAREEAAKRSISIWAGILGAFRGKGN